MKSIPRARIAIVGAGIGGLTLATAIDQLDREEYIELHIYEAAPQLEEVGAGLVVWGHTWDLLGKLGCQDDLMGKAVQLSKADPATGYGKGFRFKKSDQTEGITFLSSTVPGDFWSIHRADLQQALLRRSNKDAHLHLCSRVTECVEQGNIVNIKFEDGTTANFDLVIGADGLKSVVRRDLLTAKFPDEADRIRPIWSGSVVYRFLVPIQTLSEKAPNHPAISNATMYCGKNKHIVTYPISMGQILNVVTFVSEPEREGRPFPGEVVKVSSRDELLSLFKGWENEVVEILECANEPSRRVILTSKPLSAYGGERVALIGDAAHAMTPHLGTGAGEAMEDAVVLASLLVGGIRDGRDIPQILEAYNKLRQPKGNFVLDTSRSQGFRFELNTAEFEDLQANEAVNESRLSNLAKEINGGWAWMSTSTYLPV
ncbi:hypothetical protein AGABI2DRAFT_212377 [Agaricus bisporus var. bisporus H97]|uniref:hypothetical protein n=1 Tax=Agaricus bisporus var. bisporus (strain H97 / ATCC MYA-4626 / FGSC 10389) TaxID=936046 RepID=UPI00029F7DB3|nr:hypothetical protein AGABI2DRAFT_212377 [Agaricus bisporus var. bisporus H97]EKV42257.1 hypothetical protein AGABI2DRAFT_212377 [Agaricus bisporus var. bisporus H97]